MRKSLFILLGLLLTCTIARTQNQTLDSLHVLVLQSPADSNRVDLLIEVAKYYQKANFDSSYHYAEAALELAKSYAYLHGQAESLMIMGLSTYRMGNYDEGIFISQKSLAIADTHHFQMIQISALLNIGTIQNYQANYAQALLSFQQALRINETLQDQNINARILLNIGGIHYNYKDYNQALDFWARALSINLELNNKSSAASCMNNIALIYAIKNDPISSMDYYQRALAIFNEEEQCQKNYPYENIGSLYIDLGQLDSAQHYYNLSLQGSRACQDPILESASLAGLANVYRGRGQHKQALKHLESALQIGEAIGAIREVRLMNLALSELHEKLGNLSQTLYYYKKYTTIGDSLFNADNVAEINKLQSSYAMEKQQREFEMAQQIVAIENEKNTERQALIRNVFIISLVLVMVIAAVIYRNYKIKITANKKLQKLNVVIHSQQEELIQQAKSLNELNESLERMVEERTKELKFKNEELETKNSKLGSYAFYNPHQLRAPVAAILGLTALFENPNLDLEKASEIIANLRISAQNLDKVVREINEVLEKEDLLKKESTD